MNGRTIDSIDEAIIYLPGEIIEEILARLPVKPLLKFRCVSNSWLSIISSSHFIKTHLTVSTNMANFSYLINAYPHYQIKHCSLSSLISEPLIAASATDYPRKNPQSGAFVLGSCNGLFCISIAEREICLWNPSTRVSKKLPFRPVPVPVPVPVNLSTAPRYFNKTLGFGYDETNDDYKIVVTFQESEALVLLKSTVHIYSLKANSWKRSNDFNGSLHLVDPGKFANGKLHFWAYSSFDMNTTNRMVIVSFDLKSEEFGTVELPNCGDCDFRIFFEVLGGCLCVVCHYRYEYIRSHVWVLKEYGWTKVVTIGPKRLPVPLCMLSNGDIVFSFGTHFKILNSKEKYLGSPAVTRLGFNNSMLAYSYVESLVSL